jgi:hypothetical protein
MHFEATAVPSEMVSLFHKFVAITGWDHWKARLAAFRQQVKENPMVKEHFVERYSLELEMEQLHRKVQLTGKIKLPETYQSTALLSFIAMVARTHHRAYRPRPTPPYGNASWRSQR